MLSVLYVLVDFLDFATYENVLNLKCYLSK